MRRTESAVPLVLRQGKIPLPPLDRLYGCPRRKTRGMKVHAVRPAASHHPAALWIGDKCTTLLFPGHRFQYFADFRRHALSYHRLRRFARGQMRNSECEIRNKSARKWNSFHLTGEQTVNFSDSLFTSHFFVLYCKMRYHVKRDSGACVKVRAGEGQNALRTRRGRELRAQTRGRKERKPDEQQPSTL